MPVPANTGPETTAPDMVTTSAESLQQRDDQPERHHAAGPGATTGPQDRGQWGPSAGSVGQEVREAPSPDLPPARPLPAVPANQAPSADRPTLGRDEDTDRETWSKFLVPPDFRHIDPALYRYEISAGPAAALDVWLAAEPWADTDSDAALAMSRADERLRAVAPDPMAQYDRLRAQGQQPLEAMHAVAPLVEKMGSERWGQPSTNAPAKAGAEHAGPSADAGSRSERRREEVPSVARVDQSVAERWVSQQEAMRLLGVSCSTVARWARTGRLPATRAIRGRRYDVGASWRRRH